MLCRQQVIVEHQEVGVLAHFDGALGILYAQLLGTVDGIANNHFLNVHSLACRREWRNGSAVFVETGFLIDPACHTYFHGKIGTPVHEIAIEDLIAGPGHQSAAVPHRLAAEHRMGTFLSDESGPVLDRIATYVAAMPPRSKIGSYTQFYKTVQIGVVLNPQMGTGNLHTVLVSQCLSGQLYAVQYHAGRGLANSMHMKIQPFIVELFKDLCHLLCIKGSGSRNTGIYVRCYHRRSLNLQGTVHKDFQRVHFHVLGVEFLPEALHSLHRLLHLCGLGKHIASVHIDRQLSLLVQILQVFVNALIHPVVFWETGIEDTTHTILYGAVQPAQNRRADLLVSQVVYTVKEHGPTGSLVRVSCQVAILAHKIGQPRNRIRRFIGKTVCCQDSGIHPVAVHFALQNQHLCVRAYRVQLFLCEFFPSQARPFHHESVTLQARIFLNPICHKGQAFLFCRTHHRNAQIQILKSYAGSNMDVAVNKAWQDEFASQVKNFALVSRKTCFVAHINKFAVLHHK